MCFKLRVADTTYSISSESDIAIASLYLVVKTCLVVSGKCGE